MDRRRLDVMNEVLNGTTSVCRAAVQLKRSQRTIKRWKKRLIENPSDTLIHKNRGRTPVNKIDCEEILKLRNGKYAGLNTLFFCEKLEENEGIKISEGTVRRILKEKDLLSPKAWRRTKSSLKKKLKLQKNLSAQKKETLVQLESEPSLFEVHPTLPRSKYAGEEIQMDACIHNWFGCCKSALHIALDDATGLIVGGYFDYQETRNGYYQITKQFLSNYGVPIVIKTDRRTVFEYQSSSNKDMQNDTMTQFQHVCKNLGIELKCSSVPQYKARVERCFGTLQGRLKHELDAAGITTLEDANNFLMKYMDKFNQKYGIKNNIKSVWSGQVSKEQIDKTLVTIAFRTVDNGHAIKINCKNYAIFDSTGRQIFLKPKTKVSVVTMMNGATFVLHNNKIFGIEEIPLRQKFSKAVDLDYKEPVRHRKYIPPFCNSWSLANSYLCEKNSNYF